ncbi:MAG: hypothetical protein JW936_11855 [Sedimentisphaerales bacterium]|nr:hypothetical protein [Sedimentisphaerales bacterium]
MAKYRVLVLVSALWLSTVSWGQESQVIQGVTVASAQGLSGSELINDPLNAIDGDVNTVLEWTNYHGGPDMVLDLPNTSYSAGAEIMLDLGRPCQVEKVILTNGADKRCVWVMEISLGNGAGLNRPQLHRRVNLAMTPGSQTEISIGPAVGRYVTIELQGVGIAEIAVVGRENIPERHLCCWALDVQRDFLDKIDYLSDELGVTDLWLDYIETAWPQTVHNAGFDHWQQSGALDEFTQRGIRYWLGEHEFFTCLVNSPEMLENDQVWQRCFMQARQVYAQARELGFTGLVWDAETYSNEMAWRYTQHWGPDGLYYQRGLQYGQVLKEIWDCEIIQMWEGRLFGNFQLVGGAQYVTEEYPEDYMMGNYWFLKGIHDAGIRVSMALEKTYGAGHSEMPPSVQDLNHLNQYFEHMPDFYVNLTFEAYPFLYRVLPGFHPYNCRTQRANYLPSYLDEQLNIAQQITNAYWIYTEGTPHAGDPRDTLDAETLAEYGITAQDYIDVFEEHATERSNEPDQR